MQKIYLERNRRQLGVGGEEKGQWVVVLGAVDLGCLVWRITVQVKGEKRQVLNADTKVKDRNAG